MYFFFECYADPPDVPPFPSRRSSDLNKPKLRALLQNVRSSGMDIGAIDVNTSQPDISAVLPLKKGDPSIVFGFSTVSGVNQKVGETIVESRNTKDKGRCRAEERRGGKECRNGV